MSVSIIAFFNNKGRVGKTTLVYHLSWAFADLGRNVLAVDLDPQANLTESFLDEDRLEELWPDGPREKTLYGCVEPLIRGIRDIPDEPYTIDIDQKLHLLSGDLDLSRFENELSRQWPLCLDKDERAFFIISAFWRIMQFAAKKTCAEIIIIDMGPNLGAINRSALISIDFLVVPIIPDRFCLHDLKSIGATVRRWRDEWQERRERNPVRELILPKGRIDPLGYVVMQHGVRADRPVKAYERWIYQIPEVYAKEMLGQTTPFESVGIQTDPNHLGLVKHYRSLIPMSMEAHKPMFHLQPADGAIGSHYHAVQEAGKNFKQLAEEIEKRYNEMI
jgi:cellulose biosynthesis protein BcsQ